MGVAAGSADMDHEDPRATSAKQARRPETGGKNGDKANDEEQDKKRIAELLNQLEINSEEIYKNKIEIRQIKEAIYQAVGAGTMAPAHGAQEIISDEDAEDYAAV